MPVKFPKKHAVIADRPFVIKMNKILEKKYWFFQHQNSQLKSTISTNNLIFPVEERYDIIFQNRGSSKFSQFESW